jgi:NDP-sugar pyrophosphorylase family protein
MGSIRHALIMAAGRGRRMRPLTDAIPKPMAPFADSTLIATGISKLRPHIPNIHVTVGYKGAMLAQHLIEHGVSSIFNTDQRPNSWWIYHTLLAHLDEPVFVLTSDNVTEIDFAALEADYHAQGAPPCMVIAVDPVPGLEGDYIFAEEGVVTALDRHRPAETYCSGIQVVNPRRINALTRDEGDFTALWRQLIEQRLLMVSSVRPRRWFSVDTVADLMRADAHDRRPPAPGDPTKGAV